MEYYFAGIGLLWGNRNMTAKIIVLRQYHLTQLKCRLSLAFQYLTGMQFV